MAGCAYFILAQTLAIQHGTAVGHGEEGVVFVRTNAAGELPAAVGQVIAAAALARDVQEDLRTLQCEAAGDFRKVDVVTDQTAQVAKWRAQHRKKRACTAVAAGVVGVDVAGARLARHRVELAVDECELARRVEDEGRVPEAPRKLVQHFVDHTGDVTPRARRRACGKAPAARQQGSPGGGR